MWNRFGDKVYQLLADGQWFSPGTPSSSTTKTGHYDIAEIFLNVALITINKINPNDLNHNIIISNGVILVNLIFPIVQ